MEQWQRAHIMAQYTNQLPIRSFHDDLGHSLPWKLDSQAELNCESLARQRLTWRDSWMWRLQIRRNSGPWHPTQIKGCTQKFLQSSDASWYTNLTSVCRAGHHVTVSTEILLIGNLRRKIWGMVGPIPAKYDQFTLNRNFRLTVQTNFNETCDKRKPQVCGQFWKLND